VQEWHLVEQVVFIRTHFFGGARYRCYIARGHLIGPPADLQDELPRFVDVLVAGIENLSGHDSA
jgi:hypothetical protein